jgi:hypothetical protein
MIKLKGEDIAYILLNLSSGVYDILIFGIMIYELWSSKNSKKILTLKYAHKLD